MMYEMMNRDQVVADVELRQEYGEERLEVKKVYDGYLPYGFTSIQEWVENRQAAKHRKYMARLMREWGFDRKSGFIEMTNALSLTDTFWMKRADSGMTWDRVSLYRNPFDETIARIAFDGTGLYGAQMTTTTPELSTDGSFEKCWIREEGQIYLLKRGSEGFSNAGMEPFSEVFAHQLLQAAGTEHVSYETVSYHGKLASRCPIFTSEEKGFVNAAAYYGHQPSIRENLELAEKLGCEERFREMLVYDAVMLNVDRHAGNYGFLVENETGRLLSLAPAFDHNQAFLPYMMPGDDIDALITEQQPRIGEDFVVTAKAVMTGRIRSRLIALKDFSFTDPGEGCPKWRTELANQIKNRMIERILR